MAGAEQSESVRIIGALSKVWGDIRKAHADVPDVVLLLSPAHDERAIAHFWASRWQHPTEGARHEVVMFGEHMNRSAEQVMGTLLHEAAHAQNHVRGIKDCSANQYHNREFKRAAEGLGLEVKQLGGYGYALTNLSEEAAKRWKEQIELIRKEIQIHRRKKASAGKVGVQTPKGRNLKASCGCGHLIRVAKTTMQKTEIKCGTCNQPFTIE